MKERLFENWRILVATLFSTVLIVGAYVLVRGVESPPVAQASTETALLQSLATKDSDNDGLPDWEEALYGTDPHNPDTFHLGMTDGEAVARGLIVPIAVANAPIATSTPSLINANGAPVGAPAEGTLTAAFAKTFFSLYLSAKQANGGGDLSEAQMNDVASQALSSLSSAVTPAPDFKSAKDLAVSGSGPDALKDFAVRAEAVLLTKTSNATQSELLYLKDAVENNDASAIPYISSIAKAYRETAVGLSALSVPEELAGDDLALINAMMRISGVAADFARVNDDPLVTMLALQQYPQAILDLGNAFIGIGKVYRAAGITLPAGAPGAAFVNLIQNIADEQAAAKKP
ncbi:MAG: hypothetical protein KGH56_01410 [Patescibacteria group bacterium]|nr:hypothetical protein [Patescibacteria group bacterium]